MIPPSRRSVTIAQMASSHHWLISQSPTKCPNLRTEQEYHCNDAVIERVGTNVSRRSKNNTRVPYWWVNKPFCFTMIGRADVERPKRSVAINASRLLQQRCSNVSTASHLFEAHAVLGHRRDTAVVRPLNRFTCCLVAD